MKKNYFYSLFAALMLFVAMPATAQNFAISDLYGKWKFEAKVEWAADATDEQKAQISGNCDVTIKESVNYLAEIWGFAGSAVQQNVNRIGNKEGQDMLRLDDPNNSVYPAKLWNNLYIANLNGDNPYGYFNDETLEWEVEQLGHVYYNVDAVNGLITVPDFTIVQIDDTRTCKQGKLVATFTEVKMTLLEADAPKAVDDVSGSYKFKAGTSTYSTMENSVIPTEFAVDLVKKSDDNRTYEATIAIEGYGNVTLPTTFDGDLLSLNFDSTYIYTDEANAENSIRFADMNGSTKKQGAVQFKKNDSGFSLAAGGFSFVTDYVEEKEGKTEAATKFVQWYMDGSLKLASDVPELLQFDWVGVYTVNSKEIKLLNENNKMEWPAEFQMEISVIRSYDKENDKEVDAYAITKFMDFTVMGGGLIVETLADGTGFTIALDQYYGMAALKMNEDGTYLTLTDKKSALTELKITLNADGTLSIDDFAIGNYDYGTSALAPIVAYKNVTAEKYVAPAFNWAGTYVFAGEAEKVSADDTTDYPETFNVVVEFFEETTNTPAMYGVTEFMNTNVYNINYGPIVLNIAEDNNSATLENGNVYSLGGGSFMKIFDAEEKANPVAITLGENGAISMADFTIVAGAWGDDNNNTKVASYKNVTLKKVLGAPVLVAPVAEENKDINSLMYYSFNFGEKVVVNKDILATMVLKKGDEVAATIDSYCNVYDDGVVVIYNKDNVNVTAPGKYTLELPAGLVTAADGKEFVGAKYEFTVVAKAPSYSINPNGSADVNSIEKITIKCENVAEIAVDEAKKVWLTSGTLEYAGVVAKVGNNLEITFLDGEAVAKIEEEGEYDLTLPAGLFTMKGLDGSEVSYVGEKITYNVVAPSAVASLEVANVEVMADGSINIVYNQSVASAWDADGKTHSQTIIITNENGDELTLLQSASSAVNNTMRYISADSEYDGYNYIPTPLPAGTYTIDVSQVILNYAGTLVSDYGVSWYEWGAVGAATGTYTITIEAVDTAIDGVEAEVENDVIYDLTGRRVNEITKAGIYIVNGKKVLVK